MKPFVLALFTGFLLVAGCAGENVDPEFPSLSQTELNNFISKEEMIFLSFKEELWPFSVGGMQATASNIFIDCNKRDSVAIASGLVNTEGKLFLLNAGVIPYNDDVEVLSKYFSSGTKKVGCCLNGYNIVMNDPARPNSSIDLLRISVIKASPKTRLYSNYKRNMRIWFLIDFNIKDNSTGAIKEKVRNAKYVNEFFLLDYKPMDSGDQPVFHENVLSPAI